MSEEQSSPPQDGSERSEETYDHKVRITIDKEHYESPNPTTGAALYMLGKVKDGYALWLEREGDQDDVFIPNDGTVEHLKSGEVFFSSKRKLNPGN